MATSVCETLNCTMSFRPPWTAHMEWTVDGPATEEDALKAVDDDDPTQKIIQGNKSHPRTPALVCTGPYVQEKKGPTFWVIAADFALNTVSGTYTDPLLAPARIRWETVEVSEQYDTDLDHRPIVSSTAVPLEPLPRTVTYKRFYYTRNEPYYDVAKATTYENTTNTKRVTVAGIPVKPQRMRCCYIAPEAEYQENSTFVSVVYCFEVIFTDALGVLPFQHRVMDQAREGWYEKTSGQPLVRMKFSTKDISGYKPVDGPVRLDGTGQPLSTADFSEDVKLGEKGLSVRQLTDPPPGTPPTKPRRPKFYAVSSTDANNPNYIGSGVSDPDAIILPVSTTAVWLYFKKTALADHSLIFAKT